jgi:hypothetical protein
MIGKEAWSNRHQFPGEVICCGMMWPSLLPVGHAPRLYIKLSISIRLSDGSTTMGWNSNIGQSWENENRVTTMATKICFVHTGGTWHIQAIASRACTRTVYQAISIRFSDSSNTMGWNSNIVQSWENVNWVATMATKICFVCTGSQNLAYSRYCPENVH